MKIIFSAAAAILAMSTTNVEAVKISTDVEYDIKELIVNSYWDAMVHDYGVDSDGNMQPWDFGDGMMYNGYFSVDKNNDMKISPEEGKNYIRCAS